MLNASSSTGPIQTKAVSAQPNRGISSHTSIDWDSICKRFEEVASGFAVIIGGSWVLYSFILQRERHPKINFSCSINFIGKHQEEWLIEIVAILNNVGKAQHVMKSLTFDLNGIYPQETFKEVDRWNKQVDFPHSIKKGTFFPDYWEFSFVDAGVTSKYSHVTTIPQNYEYLLLHCSFQYKYKKYMHTTETTVKIP